MPRIVSEAHATTLDLPYPRLAEGRFASCAAFTDETLFQACGVRVAFLERTGGVSRPPYDSLNLGMRVADDDACVLRNRQLMLEAFDAQDAVLIQPRQVHGNNVGHCLAFQDAAACEEQVDQGADALVVGCQKAAALLCFADCVPVVFVSPGGSFAAVHAGWRGVVNRVWQKALEDLCELDGVAPEKVNAYIGPYIHACHFEVGPEVVEEFVREFGSSCLADESHVDMGAALRTGFACAGIVPQRIADVDVCTVCDAGKRFFSYRASGGVCGRHGAFAVRLNEGREGGTRVS